MKTFRSVLFWLHLVAGAFAGVVVLIMSLTGVALAYEKQLIEWSDRRAWHSLAMQGDAQLTPEMLLDRVMRVRPELQVAAITMRADASAPATITLEGNQSLLVDPFSGAIIGEPPAGLRSFFRSVTAWHRSLALGGANRATGRTITGAANLAFLFIVASGLYLWVPRVWKRIRFQQVLWFRKGLSPKARDFNWHNVIGIWSAIPLTIIVAGALPISYSWANALVYRVVGEMPPLPAGPPRTNDQAAPIYVSGGVDDAWRSAQRQIPSWRTMTTRFASSDRAPVIIAIDDGYGGQPQKRTTFTFDRSSGELKKTENFQTLTAGRRLRSWLRFAHTGEFYGVAGQTVAGLASFGGAVLVYTGLALAIRRLFAWIKRRRARDVFDQQRAA